jgi:endonuclease/exonuclease/phosphatase family metal-dependent hydrolase
MPRDYARRYRGNTPILLAGDFNLDASRGLHATAIGRAQFQDAFANQHVPTTPGSVLDPGRSIDWIFARGPIRAGQPRVHRSVSASDHYPLSITLAFA